MSELRFDGPLDLRASWKPLAVGPRDPTLRLTSQGVARGTRTPEGPAALALALAGPGRARVEAWGPGAAWVLARVEDLLGTSDRPPASPGEPGPVRSFARRASGVRLLRTHRVVELLTGVVLQQLVSGREAERAYRNLVHAVSEPAPGPGQTLWLPPSPEALAELPDWAFPPLGILPRQGAVLRRIGAYASRLEEVNSLAPAEAAKRMQSLQGIGPWSASSVLLRGLQAADAVPLGDWNLASMVAYNLTGEERADDERMLELLAPYAGQRGRVIRWIWAAGRKPPRHAPRAALRPLPEGRERVARSLRRRAGSR